MLDSIPVYHADDVFENMDPEIVQKFWDILDVSFGDASYTLISGREAYRIINSASAEVADRRGGASVFTTPHDLTNDGVFFAIRG